MEYAFGRRFHPNSYPPAMFTPSLRTIVSRYNPTSAMTQDFVGSSDTALIAASNVRLGNSLVPSLASSP